MTLGPIKIIPAFAKFTQKEDLGFKRELAIKSILISLGIVIFLAIVGETLLTKYQISFEALEIAGGLVLLISALNTMFTKPQAPLPQATKPTILQMAISLATPVIIPPVGVAAILIFTMAASQYPAMNIAIAKNLLIIMILDFLVMYFVDKILKIPGLMQVLQILGAVLVFLWRGLHNKRN